MRCVITFLLSLTFTLLVRAKDETPQLSGSYYCGDHLGYNVTLNLSTAGKYDARWDGCLGEYGTAEGSWRMSGTKLILTPAKETGLMMGHLTILKVRKKEGQFTFLSEEDDRRLKSDEAKLWFSFKKVTDAKKADH